MEASPPASPEPTPEPPRGEYQHLNTQAQVVFQAKNLYIILGYLAKSALWFRKRHNKLCAQ